MTRLAIEETTTRTSAANGTGAAISGVFANDQATLVLEVLAMSAGAGARISLQCSADSFVSDIQDGPTISIVGSIDHSGALRTSWALPRDFPSFPLGIASIQCRLALTHLTGVSPSVTTRAFLELGQ